MPSELDEKDYSLLINCIRCSVQLLRQVKLTIRTKTEKKKTMRKETDDAHTYILIEDAAAARNLFNRSILPFSLLHITS